MDAAFTADQEAIRRTLRALPAAHRSPAPDGPGGIASPDGPGDGSGAPDGYDPEVWRALARDPGLPGIALPEAYGGGGRGTAGLAAALEETGRALLPSPLLATAALAAPLVLALGTEDQRTALLPRIADGTLTAALAVPGGSLPTALGLTGDPTGGAWAGGGRAGGVQARPAGGEGGWRLYGEAVPVPDGASAGLLVVAAHAGGFPRSRTLLFLVAADGPVPPAGLVRTPHPSLDPTRPLARVQLRDTEAVLLGADDGADVTAALAEAGRTAAVALAAEAAGAAAGALERAVARAEAAEAAGSRAADPGVAGAFPAARLRLAELYARVRSARTAAHHAVGEPESGGLALAQALEVLRATTAETAHPAGGPGAARDGGARGYFERAAGDELLLGPVQLLRDHAAHRAGMFGARPCGGAGHGAASGRVAV
ncbi:acyl-CoA dehydrogenase family protein [Streptomyces sp. NPDC059783]|uniref:acyl-CoA dehydrogenase family protein n=1 Tax=Streptomyces sp. NPDC059783 TaxID=3346944 RepID=UPI00366846AF